MPNFTRPARRLACALTLASIPLFALLIAAGEAGAASFSNATPVAIPGGVGSSGVASLYPLPLPVSGLTGGVSRTTVTLTGFAHQCSIDVDVLLVAPSGRSSILTSDAGDCANETPLRAPVNLTFDEGAPTSVPCLDKDTAPLLLPGGTYRPTDYSPSANGVQSVCDPSTDRDHHAPAAGRAPGPLADVFAGLARPLGGWGHTLDVFNNTDPNGTWLLYVTDQYAASKGKLAGWTLNLDTSATPVQSPARVAQQPNIAAKLSTSAFKSKQKVLAQKGVRAAFTSSMAGNLAASGTVKAGRTYRFRLVKAKAVARHRTTVKLKLPSSGLKAVKKALARHKRVTAKIKLALTTATGLTTTVSKTVKLSS
jgi:hypothetical protein